MNAKLVINRAENCVVLKHYINSKVQTRNGNDLTTKLNRIVTQLRYHVNESAAFTLIETFRTTVLKNALDTLPK